MKKVITLCLFAFAMLIGSQTLVAQNSKLETMKEINAEAAKKTETLRKYVKFDNDQRDEVYEALKLYGQSRANLEGKDITDEEDAKIEKQLDDKIKSILSEQQYESYKAYVLEN
ncbi:hypothetical protein HNV10_00125 [Winogradskyella litoriviva]|uniref:Peptidylprolyl isomerase n=1 Tax=Winogradskyella litoriviva TaxID=1220182 RepID=A0ABX2DZU4_9FLAO|nr:hypothetical protein [Winogradskyella litoriviva]NRD21625.1 hypothetical protein [Winogradskyella litoriviva]